MRPLASVPLLQDFLIDSAERLPGKVALVTPAARLTYADLDRQSDALAQALLRAGVERGDRTVIFMDNSAEAVVAFFAVLKANAVAVMANPLTRSDKLAYYLEDSGASALIAHSRLSGTYRLGVERSRHLRALIVQGPGHGVALGTVSVTLWEDALAGSAEPPVRRCIDQDLAAIIYTSGSTGEPKGVMLSHRNMLAAAGAIATYLELTEEDVTCSALPLAFDYGLYQALLAFRAGARLVLERSFAYPAQVMSKIEEEHVTGFPGVPTAFAALLELKARGARWDLGGVRYVTNTAAALPAKHIAFLKELFPRARIYSMYGLTECKRCTYLPPEDLDRKPGSVGVAIPNTELWLVDAEGRRVPRGEIGQLVIRGATVMRGYWRKPDATAERLKPGPIPGEQVLYTGDLCRQDEEGYLYFVARMDDVIKSRGEKVAPKEVEMALTDIPGVREAAVIGVPDELLGEAVKAFVVLEEGSPLTPQELLRGCQERLEPASVPRHIQLVQRLPRTSTGKISKAGLV